MKISISALRRRLTPGKQFTATYIGPNCNAALHNVESTRLVVSQTANQMVSKTLDGVRPGAEVYCTWNGVTAEEHDGYIWLTQGGDDEPFLKLKEL